ncbi:hypothetical protein [Azotosporobacter soli]|uniref:hypothetical protein n=1 Tax=Azotosporobacter soli TaxID=3055040 RepID=UPI0031FF2B7E
MAPNVIIKVIEDAMLPVTLGSISYIFFGFPVQYVVTGNGRMQNGVGKKESRRVNVMSKWNVALLILFIASFIVGVILCG